MKVIFNNNNLPPHTKDLIEEIATNKLLERFPSLGAAKRAFDQHRQMPTPHDSAQTALESVLEFVRVMVEKDFGPSVAQDLHPIVKFDQ